MTIPDLRDPIPDDSVAIPDLRDPIPGTLVAIPDLRDPIPGTLVAIPDARDPIPDDSVAIPDARDPIPDDSVAIPDARVPIPDTLVAIPGRRGAVSREGFRVVTIYPTYFGGKWPGATSLGGEGHDAGHGASRWRSLIAASTRRIAMTTTTKTEISSNLAACASGLTANFPATQTWVFSGKTYQRADILSLLQGFILATQTTKTTNEAWRASVEVESAQLAALHPVLSALKKALEAQFGATSTKMAEFGFAPAKAPVKTAASKAASAAKASATRKAKKAALATVKTTVAAPPATPTAPSPVTAPVPAKTG